MHCHQHAWDAALRVAEAHDAAAAAGVFAKQGDALAAADRLHEAEAAYLHVRAPFCVAFSLLGNALQVDAATSSDVTTLDA